MVLFSQLEIQGIFPRKYSKYRSYGNIMWEYSEYTYGDTQNTEISGDTRWVIIQAVGGCISRGTDREYTWWYREDAREYWEDGRGNTGNTHPYPLYSRARLPSLPSIPEEDSEKDQPSCVFFFLNWNYWFLWILAWKMQSKKNGGSSGMSKHRKDMQECFVNPNSKFHFWFDFFLDHFLWKYCIYCIN